VKSTLVGHPRGLRLLDGKRDPGIELPTYASSALLAKDDFKPNIAIASFRVVPFEVQEKIEHFFISVCGLRD
jgi:hypothetical protein